MKTNVSVIARLAFIFAILAVAIAQPVPAQSLSNSASPSELVIPLNWSRSTEPAINGADTYSTSSGGAVSAGLALPLDPNQVVFDNGLYGTPPGNIGATPPGNMWASWTQRLAGCFSTYEVRHFQATFSLPVAQTDVADFVLFSPFYTDIGNIIPINDDVYVFVNGISVGQRGVDHGAIHAPGQVNETDGWYQDGSFGTSAVNALQPGSNTIDLVTEEHCQWGGLGLLNLKLLVSNVTYTISGNAGIDNATLSYTDGTAKTATSAVDGTYTFTVSSGWSGTVIPSKNGYTFTPSNRTYSNVQANQTSQDYTAKMPVIDYFALGDSIASGHGLGDDGSACRRSVVRGYPWLVRNELLKRYTTVNFQLDHWLACSGATAMRPDNKTLKQDSNKWLENQVTYAITHLIPNHPTLVTITIGSNDFGWADPANFLSHLYAQQGDAYVHWVDGVVGDYTSGREFIVRAQVARLLAYDNVSVVITGIHNPFNQTSLLFALPSGNDCGLWEFACYTRTEYSVTKLNGAMIDIAFRTNLPSRLRFAPVELKFQLDGGHQSPSPNCGTSLPTTAQTWIQYPGDPNSNSISLLPGWIIKRLPQKYGGDCFHPNDLGAAAYAAAVNTAAILVGR